MPVYIGLDRSGCNLTFNRMNIATGFLTLITIIGFYASKCLHSWPDDMETLDLKIKGGSEKVKRRIAGPREQLEVSLKHKPGSFSSKSFPIA